MSLRRSRSLPRALNAAQLHHCHHLRQTSQLSQTHSIFGGFLGASVNRSNQPDLITKALTHLNSHLLAVSQPLIRTFSATSSLSAILRTMSDNDVSSNVSSIASGNSAVVGNKASIINRVRAGGVMGSISTTSISGLEQSDPSSSLEATGSLEKNLSETITPHSSANRRRVRKSSSVTSDMSGRPRPVSVRLSSEEIAQKWFILEPELAESVPDAPPPGPVDIGDLSRAEIKRQETIYELYVTESDYVANMLVLQRLFIAPLAKHQILADRERMMLFSNVEQLIPVHQELFSAIQQQRVNDRCVISALGTLFLKLSHFLKMYNVYCANYTEALNLLQQLLRCNQRFAVFVHSTTARPECGGLDLAGLLIKPVQRLCKYPLFLREVLKHTPPDHQDHGPLKKALELMEKVVQRVNEGRRFLEEQHTLLEVMAKLDFGSRSSNIGGGLSASFGASSAKLLSNLLKSPAAALGGKPATTSKQVSRLPSNFHRRLVRQGGLFAVDERSGSRKQKPRLAVLFSDALVLAKPKGIQHQLLRTDVDNMRIPLSTTQGVPAKSRREQEMEAEADDANDNTTVYSVKHVVLLVQVLRMTDLGRGKLARLPAPPAVFSTPTSSDATELEVEYSLANGGGSDILRLAFPASASCTSWHQSLAKILSDVATTSTRLTRSSRSESREILASSMIDPPPAQEADVDGFLAAHSQYEISAHNRAQDHGKGISIVGTYAPPTPTVDAVDVSMLKGVPPPMPKRHPPPPVPPRQLSLAMDCHPRRRSLTDPALPELAATQASKRNSSSTKLPSGLEHDGDLTSKPEETTKARPKLEPSLPAYVNPRPPPITLPPSPVSLASQLSLDVPPNPFWSPLDPPEDNQLADPPIACSTVDEDAASIVIPTVVATTPGMSTAPTRSPSTATFIGVPTISRSLVVASTSSNEHLPEHSGSSGDAHHVAKVRRASIVRPARQGSNSLFGRPTRQGSNSLVGRLGRQESSLPIGTTGSGRQSNASLSVPEHQLESAPVRPPSLGRPHADGAPSPRLARVAQKNGPSGAGKLVEHGSQQGTDTHSSSSVKVLPVTMNGMDGKEDAAPPAVVIGPATGGDKESGSGMPVGPGRVRALKIQLQSTGSVPVMGGPRPDVSASAVPHRPSKPPHRPAASSIALDDLAQASHYYTWANPSDDNGRDNTNKAEFKAAMSSRLRASTEELTGSVVRRQSPNMTRRLRQTTAPGHLQSANVVPGGKGVQGRAED